MEKIIIKGARTHNLKNINLEIPKNKLIVITGLSGSGKSSLAFDTIYAEGQRRYVESLSAYARQFLELMDKPDVDLIEGLSPSIAIEQHNPSRNPRSTVGTVTEIYDYLRLLFARIGDVHCPKCLKPLKSWTVDGIINDIKKKFLDKEITITSPLVIGRIGTYQSLFENYKKKGFVSFRIDGKFYSYSSIPELDRYKKHNISIMIDKFKLNEDNFERLTESIDLAFNESEFIEIIVDKKEFIYSKKNSCPYCGITIKEIEPRLFSFNSPYGACERCDGIGFITEIDEKLAIDFEKSINEGGIKAWDNPITTKTNRWKNSWRDYYYSLLKEVCDKHNIDMNKKLKEIDERRVGILLYGDGEFEGVLNNLKRRYNESESEFVKTEIYTRYMKEIKCPQCKGKRLKDEALSVFIAGKNIAEISDMTIDEINEFFNKLELTQSQKEISKLIMKEIKSRISFLINVGLGYLTLSRYSTTLSGGEAQRISLATQLGSRLTGVLYVLDEPTIGLHPQDNEKLINSLKSLRNIGNTLIVVEHDEKTIRNADWIIELGPGAGRYGGEIIFEGRVDEIIKNERSITGKYLSKKLKVIPEKKQVETPKSFIEIKGANQFNLKNINVKIPLNQITVICGVSGSGKSTLLYEILYKGIMKKLNPLFKEEPGQFDEIKVDGEIEKVILIDQSPIGRTSRSNPATYIGFFDEIRKLFSLTSQSKRKGYTPSRFSFNIPGGRCEYCKGEGELLIQMQFMPDVHIKCPECEGKRFNKETLEVKYRDKNIYEILEMEVSEALEFFKDIPRIYQKLKLLNDVGLSYIKLGQSSTTLSGGEAQRIKIAYELSRKTSSQNLYIMDEPTTGLHFDDVKKLLTILDRLKNAGNTIVIIEHNIDVIKFADWIVELGPGGGPNGGKVLYQGSFEEFKKTGISNTTKYL